MKILRAYVLREHVAPFGVTLAGLTAVLLVGNLIKFAELIIGKGVSPVDVLRLIVYMVPYLLSFTIPIAAFTAMVLAFGRLSTDYELIAMRASGVAPVRLVWPLLMVGSIISAVLLILHDRVVPAAHQAARQQLKAIGIKQPTAYLEPGMFIKAFPPYTIFVYQVEGKVMHHVRIYQPQPDGPTRTIIADRGQFEPLPGRQRVRLKLLDGTVDEWDPQQPGAFYKVSFTTYTIDLAADRDDPEQMGKKLKELTFRELFAQRGELEAQRIDSLPMSLEIHRRVASSFATFVFVLFGLVLGLRLHHHERLVGYLWVLGIVIGYYLGMVGMNALALKGVCSAALAMWVPNLLGMSTGGVLLARALRR